MRHIYNIISVAIVGIIICSCKGSAQNDHADSTKSKKPQLLKIGSNDWIFDKVVGQTIYFKGDKKFKTNLFDLKYIGQLKAKNKAPFLIFSGLRHYSNGVKYVNPGLWVHSPTDGSIKEIDFREECRYPGKMFDYANTLEMETRVFYGNCLDNGKEGVFLMTRDRIDFRGKFDYHFTTVAIINDEVHNVLKKVDSVTYVNYKIPTCTEIPGIIYKRQ